MEHILKLEVNGKFLTFYPNAKVTMLRKSPLFLNEADPGSRIFTFTIPAEPNTEILDFANLLFNNKKIATLDCNVYLKGNFYKRAKLDIVSFTKLTFDIRVRFDKPYFVEAADKKIRSFEYNAPTPFRYWQAYYIEVDYAITFYNNPPAYDHYLNINFLNNITNEFNQYRYDYLASNPRTSAQYIQDIANIFNADIKNHGISAEFISPNIIRFKNYANRGGGLSLSITPSSTAVYDIGPINIISTPPNIRLRYLNEISHANETLAYPNDYDYVYFPVLNPTGLEIDSSLGTYNEVVNDYYASGAIVGSGFQGFDFATSSGNGRVKNGFSPFPYLHKVLKYIHDELKITVDDQFFDEELKTLVLFHNNIITHNYFNALPDTKVSSSFRFTEIIPDITYKELISSLSNLFCLVFDFESNDDKLRIIPRKKIIESKTINDFTKKLLYDYYADIEPKIFSLKYTWYDNDELVNELNNNISYYNKRENVATVSDLALITNVLFNDISLVYKENFYYYYSFVLSWFSIGEALQNYINNKSTEDIISGFSTLFNNSYEHIYKDGSLSFIRWKTPYVKKKLNIDGVNNIDFSERLLFYRGLKPCLSYVYGTGESSGTIISVDSGVYPYGTYHNYDKDGNKIGNYTLAWNAPDGLIDYWWQLWLDITENTFPLKFTFSFTTEEFMEIDLLEKFYVENQEYLIDEMQVELTTEISPVTIKCYQNKTA